MRLSNEEVLEIMKDLFKKELNGNPDEILKVRYDIDNISYIVYHKNKAPLMIPRKYVDCLSGEKSCKELIIEGLKIFLSDSDF